MSEREPGETDREYLHRLYPDLGPIVKWMEGKMRVDGKRDILERLEDDSTEVTSELLEDAREEIGRLREYIRVRLPAAQAMALLGLLAEEGRKVVGDE